MRKGGSRLSLDGRRQPLWLVLELTHRCPLRCPWCNNPLELENRTGELATDEWKRVMREARSLGSLQLGFSGGEPALRPDLEELAAEGNALGFYTNLITSGMGLTAARLGELKQLGLKQVQLSIQSCEPAVTDWLVGARAHEQKLRIAREIKALGFPMVLNVPLCRQNIDQVEGILAMAEDLGADYLELANIQYYNWALLNRAALLPTRAQLERAETAVRAARERLGKRMTIYFVIPDYYDGRPKACMNGWGAIHLTIAPDGSALPCQEARVIKGLEFPNVRDRDLDWIWHDSPVFNEFRGEAWMKEPCRSCESRKTDFAGCRCQAYLLTGDAANPDPACSRAPLHQVIAAAVAEAEAGHRVPRPLVFRKRGAVTAADLPT